MTEALSDLEKFLHAKTRFPPLVRLAMAHYQFEAIHPFLDGNGRIGRLLVSLLLCRDGLLREPLLYLSDFLERNREEYYERLLAVSRAGAWSSWIEFFLRGVAEQSQDAVWRAGRLLELWREHRRRFEAARSSSLVLRLVDHLFESPVITIPRAARLLGVTQRSASLIVAKLQKNGILAESSGRERNRVFVAARILAVIEADQGGARSAPTNPGRG
jgi:Fic family protein